MKALVLAVFFLLRVIVKTETKEAVDFVIVGAGTAGCVLAARMCSNLPNASIILLERALPRDRESEFLVRAPRNSLKAWNHSRISELYDSEPNRGLFGRPTEIITGKTLGGSSSINGMQWSVPLEGTVEKWNIAGLSSQNWKTYLLRVYHTVGFAQPPKSLQPIHTEDYIRAAQRAGFPEDRKPFSDQSRKGVWVNRLAVDGRARRIDSCAAYVSPVAGNVCNHNLRIIQSGTVKRVLLDRQSPPQAYGVNYVNSGEKNSKIHTIFASKEVLVAAGPYESPKLLQLSGIGPRKVLEKAKVPLRVDLAVGTTSHARAVNSITSVRTGLFRDPADTGKLINSTEARLKWEQGQGGVLGVALGAANGIMREKGYFTAAPSLGLNMSTVLSSCLPNPKSFGHIRIRDNNPFSTPSVQLNLLNRKSEVRNLLFCMRRLRDIHEHFPPRFQLFEVFPSSNPLSETFLRKTSSFSYHIVGGCSVDTTVNPYLKVKGVRGLRIIDSSIFKSMPASAGPLVSTYALAEFMAERISCIYK